VRTVLEASADAVAAARHLLQTYGSEYAFGPSVPISYWQNFVVRARGAGVRVGAAERAAADGC
jgi:hypothetical protein